MRFAAPIAPLLALIMAIGCSPALRGGPGTAADDVPSTADDEARGAGDAGDEGGQRPVVVTLYGMSRCPHCARAVMTLVPLIRELGDRLRLEVEYVGGVVDGELDSLHGEPEILGDMIELCVHDSAPRDRWMQFIECYHRDWRRIPDGWEECGRQSQVELAAVARCVEGERGRELLAASFGRAEQVGVQAAPTFVIDGELTIVGGQSGNRLAQVLCARVGEPLPPLCELVDPLPYVPVTVLTDERCEHAGCDVSADLRVLRDVIWGASVNTVTYQSDPGRALYRAAGLKRLPALLIGEELEDDVEAWRELRFLRRGGAYYIKTLGRFDPIAGRWDEPLPVTARLVVDERCPERECATASFEEALEEVLPSVRISKVEYLSKAGRGLYARVREATELEPPRLPFVLFSKSVTDDEEFYGRVEDRLRPVDDDYFFPLGEWDPTAEICGNDEDDDGDGRADCLDSDCRDTLLCRPEKRRRLDLFAMSRCPYALQVFRAMKQVVAHFGGQRSKVDFNVHFIGVVDPEGELRAMHGPDEVEENMRQVCVQHLSSKTLAFVDYLACRAGSAAPERWQECLPSSIAARDVERCVEGPAGPRLLRQSYELAEELGFTGSPSWLLNNRYPMDARSPAAIVEAFCERNPSPECERPLDDAEGDEDAPAAPGGCGGE